MNWTAATAALALLATATVGGGSVVRVVALGDDPAAIATLAGAAALVLLGLWLGAGGPGRTPYWG